MKRKSNSDDQDSHNGKKKKLSKGPVIINFESK